jgi:hypothetical protein
MSLGSSKNKPALNAALGEFHYGDFSPCLTMGISVDFLIMDWSHNIISDSYSDARRLQVGKISLCPRGVNQVWGFRESIVSASIRKLVIMRPKENINKGCIFAWVEFKDEAQIGELPGSCYYLVKYSHAPTRGALSSFLATCLLSNICLLV